MQEVKHAYTNCSPIFSDLESFYSIVSNRSAKGSLLPILFDDSFADLWWLFQCYGECAHNIDFRHKHYDKLALCGDKKNMVVCFSGGKDSIATALHYKQLGYNVYLYHMRHINFALTDEYIYSQKLAEQLGMPIYVDTITLSGHHDWCEHPMKNIIIANGGLNYAVRENIGTKIAFGNYYTSSVIYDRFDFCGGDDQEMWRAYENIIRRIIPNFHVYVPLKNLGTTLNKVCNEPELLDLSVSCLGRANLRNYRWKWVNDKFGIQLPKNRCGSCYKCCIEYIYMADHGLQKYSKEYYQYCLNQLKKNTQKESGFTPDIQSLWETYFFYNIKKSYANDLLLI